MDHSEMSLDELNSSIESRNSLTTSHVAKKFKKSDELSLSSSAKKSVGTEKPKRKYTKHKKAHEAVKSTVIIPSDNLSPPPSCSPLSSQSSQFSTSLSFSSMVSLPYNTTAITSNICEANQNNESVHNQYLNQFEAHFASKCYQTLNGEQSKLDYTNFDFDNENSMDSEDESFNESGCGKRDRNGAQLTQQRQAANMRERRRMQSINDAFEGLRIHLPTLPYEKKISKVETLKLAIGYINFLTDLLNKDTRYSSQSSSSKEVKKFVYTFKDFDYDSSALVGHSLSWKNSRELNLTHRRTFVSKLWHITSVIKADEELRTFESSGSHSAKAKMSLSLSDNEDDRSDESEDEDEMVHKASNVVLNEQVLFSNENNVPGILASQQQQCCETPATGQFYTCSGYYTGYESQPATTTAFISKNNSYINQTSYYTTDRSSGYNFNAPQDDTESGSKVNKYYSDLNNNNNGCQMSQHGIENIPEGMHLSFEHNNQYQQQNGSYFGNSYAGNVTNHGQYYYNVVNPDESNVMSINNSQLNDYSFNNQMFYQS